MTGNGVRQATAISMGPLTYCSCCEVSSLVGSDAVWNTRMVEKAVSPWIAVLPETLGVRKANPYPEQLSIPLRTKHCLFHDEVVQRNEPATR